MRERAGDAAQNREGKKSRLAHAPRHGAAEGEHPRQIHQKMHPARMHHHVGHERGDGGEVAAGKLERRAAIARRDEGERKQQREVELVGQQAPDDLHQISSARDAGHAARHVEDRLTRGHGRRALQNRAIRRPATITDRQAPAPGAASPALACSLLMSVHEQCAAQPLCQTGMFTLAWRKDWAGFWVRCSVSRRVGYAAANEQAALRVLGSRTQWPRCAAPLRDRAGQDRLAAARDLHRRRHRQRSATGSGSPAREICEQFGRELRGADLLGLWEDADRDAVASLLRNVFADAAVGHGRFRAYSCTNRQASFEFVLLPLIHTGETINRVLGAITAIEPPFWLGAEPLLRQEIVELNLHWPDGVPAFRRKAARRSSASAQPPLPRARGRPWRRAAATKLQ